MQVIFRSFRLLILLVALTFLSTAAHAQTQAAYRWAKGLQGRGFISTSCTAISPNGDVFTGCNYRDSVSFGNQTYPLASGENSLLLKHSSAAGNEVGSLLLGVKAFIYQIKVDRAGNVYATGQFSDRVESGATTLASANGRADCFVGKWDASGALLWLKHGIVSRSAQCSQLTIDDLGRVTIAGFLSGTITFDATTISALSASRLALFCFQLDGTTGAVRWSRVSATNGFWWEPGCSLISEAVTGNLILTGYCFGEIEWNGQLVATAADRLYWLKLSNDGNLLTSFASSVVSSGACATSAENGYSFLAFNCNDRSSNLTLNGAPFSAPTGSSRSYTALARLDPGGIPQWMKVIAGNVINDSISLSKAISGPTGGSSSGYSNLYIAGTFSSRTPVSVGNNIFLNPSFGWESGYIASFDGVTGTPIFATKVAGAPLYSSVEDISIEPAGQISLAGNTYGDSAFFGGFGPGGIIVSYPNFDSGIFTAKLISNYNQVQGAAFADANANGTPDAGETLFGGLIIESQPEGLFFSTDAGTGAYSAITELGVHQVSLASPPQYYTLPPASIPQPATFSTFGNIAGNRHFALQPIPNQQDLQAFVTAFNRARPGFGLRYRVTYRNIGTTTTSGTVTVQLDPRLTYLSNTANGTRTGNALDVIYANLAPGESRSFDIQFQVPTTVTVGAVLNTVATVLPVATDLVPADNTATDALTVTASYDPNDIRVNWPRLTPTQVSAGEWLEYTIRFENLGTDTAFSVMLRDALPAALLNLGTLDLFAASHGCTYRLAAGGLLTVQFPSILLPHRGANVLRSSGFVRFRIRPIGTLAVGDLVPNKADIHFDFNAPITTNTAITEVWTPVGLPSGANANALNVWPNPTTTGLLHVALNGDYAVGPLALTLVDNVGRTVLTSCLNTSAETPNATTTLDVRGLPAGLYVLRGQQAGHVFTRRVVVR
jgi:uncharacterized repeat protein (TIGR01451 family)